MFITLFKKESVLAFGVSSREETIQRNLVPVLKTFIDIPLKRLLLIILSNSLKQMQISSIPFM